MQKIRLGRTGLMVTKTAMGCLPVQRCNDEAAIELLRAAYDGGINYFDTANAYSDSEKKIGLALSDVRDKIIISTKSAARDKETVLKHIENSLRMMKTDYIDLFQFHQVTEVPDPNDPNGAYAAALEAKERGWIRHIGVTSHRVNIAEQCIASGWFETLQFPFSYISDERDLALADKCREADMGFIAMKGLAGGMLTNVRACHAFMKQYGACSAWRSFASGSTPPRRIRPWTRSFPSSSARSVRSWPVPSAAAAATACHVPPVSKFSTAPA